MYFGSKIQQYRDDIIRDLAALVSIPSVCGEPKEGMPLGERSAEALNCILKMAEKMGFATENVGNYAGHAEYGEGDEVAAVLTHVDVVPAGDGWDTPPFTLTQKGTLYFGRGVADDKGEAIVALYCLKALKDAGVKGKRRIRAIFGAGEEINSGDLGYYFKKETMPVMGFTPDAEYGICNREKGILHLEIKGSNSSSAVKKLCAGTVVNAVPNKATALVDCNYDQFNRLVEASKKSAGNFIIEKTLSGAAVYSIGTASHAMQPQKGLNAATYLIQLLAEVFSEQELGVFLTFVNTRIGTELNGASIGIQQSDEPSGELTLNLGLADVSGDTADIGLDIRYPVTAKGDELIAAVRNCAEKAGLSMEVTSHQLPLFLPEDSPFIKLLQDSYAAVIGTPAELYSTGGGTYARGLNGNGVAFGPFFPDEPDRHLHDSKENIDIVRFMVHAEICLEAMYRMFTE